MIVRLTEKSPFCTIGSYSFSMGQPELDVDVDSLTPEHKTQLLYNINRGVLTTSEDISGLQPDKQDVVAPPKIVQQEIVNKVTMADQKQAWEVEQKELNALLRKTISTIKKETKDFRLGRLRRLLELEKKQKNRKSLVSFITDHLNMLQAQTTAVVQGQDVGGMVQPDPQAVSTQVSDIVESDEETVVLPQQVLNQLGD